MKKKGLAVVIFLAICATTPAWGFGPDPNTDQGKLQVGFQEPIMWGPDPECVN
jgi:hypothetical protein